VRLAENCRPRQQEITLCSYQQQQKINLADLIYFGIYRIAKRMEEISQFGVERHEALRCVILASATSRLPHPE
jgi:hypothetical protein